MTRFHQTPAFILGDWGTSRLRLYLCDAANNVLETREARGAAAARGEHEQVLDAETSSWHAVAGPLPMRAVVVVPVLKAQADPAKIRTPEGRLDEAIGLAHAIDLNITAGEIVMVSQPKPATLIGSGKIEEITLEVK